MLRNDEQNILFISSFSCELSQFYPIKNNHLHLKWLFWYSVFGKKTLLVEFLLTGLYLQFSINNTQIGAIFQLQNYLTPVISSEPTIKCSVMSVGLLIPLQSSRATTECM